MNPLSRPDVATLRIGIAITTTNRRDMVCAQIAAIRRLTGGAFDLVICDDGSSDGTPDAVRQTGEVIIAGVNRGIAWNKNRGIYYLMAVRGCDIAILLDDDTLPLEFDWQERWVRAAANFGHVNFIYPGMAGGLDPASCTADAPGLSPALCGVCITFHRFAWSTVGYMDPRFGKYGHEHTEFTNRFLNNGYGGKSRSDEGRLRNFYFVIGGGIKILSAPSHGTAESARENSAVWSEIIKEKCDTYRTPWRDERQRLDFLAEIAITLRQHKVTVPSMCFD